MQTPFLARRRARTTPLRRNRRRPDLETLEGRTLLTAGALDTSYGGTGVVITTPSYQFYAQGLAVQSDLKTVVVGDQLSSLNTSYPFYSYPYNTSIIRYNPDGSLDASFGNGGIVALATTSAKLNGIHNASVAIQTDGKIVIATNTTTYTYHPATKKSAASYTINSSSMAILRLNPNGSLDTSFGNGGESVISIPNAFEVTSGVAILPSGQIVVAGTDLNGEYAGPEFVVARLTSSGTLDMAFGPNGQGYNDLAVSPTSSTPTNGVDALGVDGSGNILVGGYVRTSVAPYKWYRVVRYTPGGLIDTTFANQGVFDLSTSSSNAGIYGVDGIGFQPDGHIILGLPLVQPGGPGVVRLNTDGSIDTAFGSNGFYVEQNSTGWDAVAVQPDAKVLLEVSPEDSNGNVTTVRVDRLQPGGTLDPTFGAGGNAVIPLPSSVNGSPSEGLIIGPDGKITGAEIAVTSTQFAEIGTFRLLNDITSNTAMAAAAPLATSPPGAALGPSGLSLAPPVLDSPDLWDASHWLTKRRGMH